MGLRRVLPFWADWGLVRNADALSMNCIRLQRASGTFGMSNQERPDLLQAIKHLRGRRVVKDSRRPLQRLGTHGIGMARWKSKRPAPRLERAFCVRARISGRGSCRRVNRHRYCAILRRHHRRYGNCPLHHRRHHASCHLHLHHLRRDSFRHRHQSYGLVRSSCGWEQSTSAKVPSMKVRSNCDSGPSRSATAQSTNAKAPNSCGSARSKRMTDCCSSATAADTSGCCRSSMPGDYCCCSQSWGAIAADTSGYCHSWGKLNASPCCLASSATRTLPRADGPNGCCVPSGLRRLPADPTIRRRNLAGLDHGRWRCLALTNCVCHWPGDWAMRCCCRSRTRGR